MYSRSFGNNTIESDGVLHEAERRYDENNSGSAPVMSGCGGSDAQSPECGCGHGHDIRQIFKNISTEDLLLIAIGILLLLDKEQDNDVLLIAIAFLLLF